MPKAPKAPKKGSGSIGKPKTTLGGGVTSVARGQQAWKKAVEKEVQTRKGIASMSGPAQGAADERNRRVNKTVGRVGLDMLGSSQKNIARSVLKNPNASLEDMARQITNDKANRDKISKEIKKTSGNAKTSRSEAMKKAWMTRRRNGGARGGG